MMHSEDLRTQKKRMDVTHTSQRETPHTHVHTHTCTRTRAHARTHACTHTHTHIHTHNLPYPPTIFSKGPNSQAQALPAEHSVMWVRTFFMVRQWGRVH